MPDISTVKLSKWNIIGYARRHFQLDNGYLNYWHNVNAAGVAPVNSMCLNGVTMIVTDELNFELVAGKRKWFMQAGCLFCMRQLLIIFTHKGVKIKLAKAKNTSNNGYYASVAIGVISNALPLIGFPLSRIVRIATTGLSYGLAQSTAIRAPTPAITYEDTTGCTCRL
jgi:hypothetical protein